MIKLVLFDIGGVLINYENVFKTASDELSIARNLIDKTFDEYDRQITVGEITPQQLYIKCLEENNIVADQDYNFLLSWIRDYSSIAPTANLVKRLHRKYRIGLFSNIYKNMVPELVRQKLIPDIDYAYTFISCDVGMQKPDQEIYDYISKVTDILPGEILFIDDKQENLEPAVRLGWETFLFNRSDPEEGARQLGDLLL